MITPTKHTDIRYSVLFVANKIVKYLKKEDIIKFNDLVEMLISELGYKVKSNINASLLFLYALNKIKYIKELDAIKIIDNKDNTNEN